MNTIINLFEAQVEKTPDNIAVRFDQDDLTYAELNRHANQLAHYLQKQGVGREHLVALFLERSLEMVIGILGVLKAGAAYVPIDPDFPAERVEFMLNDTGINVLLCQSHLGDRLSAILKEEKYSQPLSILDLDSQWEEIGKGNEANPVNSAQPDNLVYVIYTSGSTGTPKGVMNEHKGVYNRIVWMRDAIPLTANDRILQKTPYSFDVSVWEIFWPLLSGARLVIAKPGGHRDSNYIVDQIIKQGITGVQFVPSMLQVFLLNQDIDKCTSLRRVICGGEVLTSDLQRRLLSVLDVEMYNLYGPTEASIGVTAWRCNQNSNHATVPIGFPLPNTQIYLLDSQLQSVPPGEAGELFIGGIQVARGYLNQPELTAQRFIPDPFRDTGDGRLYKTGDLARQLPDGSFLYLGRMDHQVKIRGNRVELGEIEATLVQHSQIRESVVISYEISPGNKTLAAYVVPNQQGKLILKDLRSFLSEKLPEYMVPSTFTILSKLPLTNNGKVDRQALPEPTQIRPDLIESYVPPRNHLEETLVNIWEEVIGFNGIGIYDNFLELGGDSIISIHIASLAHQAGIQLSPNQILAHPTIARLAEIAGAQPAVNAEQGLITGSLPLTPYQRWFVSQGLEEKQHAIQYLLLEIPQSLDDSLLEKAIEQLWIYHDTLRIHLSRHETGWQQEITSPDKPVPFVRMNLSGVSPAEQKEALHVKTTELMQSLNLRTGPLARLALVDTGPDTESYLVMVIHSLIVDQISWRILLEDFELAYQNLRQDKPVQLPSKTTSFKFWAQRLQDHADSEYFNQDNQFWLSMSPEEPIDLPVDSTEHMVNRTGDEFASFVSYLDAPETRALLTEVPRVYHTMITDVLLTALLEASSQWTGRNSLLVDILGHGREALFDDIDLSRTVGCFTAMYPVLLDQDSKIDIGDNLISIKEQLRAVPKGGIGYGVARFLSSDSGVIQELEKQPPAQVSFQYLGQLDNLLSSNSIFKLSEDFKYPQRQTERNHQYLLEIIAAIVDEKLLINIQYNRSNYQQETIERFSQNYLAAIKNLVAHSKLQQACRFSPSDFPEANLNQQELDDLLAEISNYEE